MMGGVMQIEAQVMNIVVAGDHALVLDTFQTYLARLQGDIVISKANSLEDAIACALEAERTVLAIIDLNIPGMNGLEGLGVMKRYCPDVPVVLLTRDADPVLVREALSHGAVGVIPKKSSGPGMLKALRVILSGETYVPFHAMPNDPEDRRVSSEQLSGPSDSDELLTSREWDVLAVLVEGKSNKRIARELGVKDVTVAYHLKSIFRKIKVTSRTEAVTKILGLSPTTIEETPSAPAKNRLNLLASKRIRSLTHSGDQNSREHAALVADT